MKKYITDDKIRVNNWTWDKVGRDSPFHPPSKYQAFGVEQDGELIAGVVFDSFAKDARCSMHCAGIGKRWLTREFLRICFDYVFNMANCKVVINTVVSSNVESIEFTKHVGFTEACRIKDGAGNEDLVVLVLHRNDCRWIGA